MRLRAQIAHFQLSVRSSLRNIRPRSSACFAHPSLHGVGPAKSLFTTFVKTGRENIQTWHIPIGDDDYFTRVIC
jgi:hypothetical protein